MTATVVRGDARALPLADNSVDLIVSSPPYFALRSYTDGGQHYPGQLGSEATPAEFVDALLEVTRECMRVLKPTGSLWINLGDKYSQRAALRRSSHQDGLFKDRPELAKDWKASKERGEVRMPHQNVTDPPTGQYVPEKSLIGIPWRYALRCIDDLGLTLRRDQIWSKPNGLPESVTDRCRTSHEYWFHFVLQPRYYSAVDEIRERYDPKTAQRYAAGYGSTRRLADAQLSKHTDYYVDGLTPNPLGKLPGSVWEIPTEPLKAPAHIGVDHFAAFPLEWPLRIIRGWSPPGVCTACGEGRRPVSVTEETSRVGGNQRNGRRDAQGESHQIDATWSFQVRTTTRTKITGYACACPRPGAPARPAVVLDPFGGTGTTALAAHALGRHGITVDLSHDYGRLAQWRTTDERELARALRVRRPAVQADGQITVFDLLEDSA